MPYYTAAQFIDAIRERYELPSDRKVAKLLGVSSPSVTRFRSGEDAFSDCTARKVADLLDLDPLVVVMCAHAQRAKSDADRALWREAIGRIDPPDPARLCIMLSTEYSESMDRAPGSGFLAGFPVMPSPSLYVAGI